MKGTSNVHALHVSHLIFVKPEGGKGSILRQILSAVLITSIILCGCTSESRQSGEGEWLSTNRAPSILSARMVPTPVIRNKQVSVQIDATDPDGDLITIRHQWRVNDHPIAGQTGFTMPEMLKRGDRLAVDLIPYDGKLQGSPYRTQEAVVGNTPPEVKGIVLEPRDVRIGDRLQAKAEGIDADEDTIDYRFRWWRNNEEVSGEEDNTLETASFTKGDTIVVQVTPYDSDGGRGKPMFAEPITILNSPPKITSMPSSAVTKRRYEYHVAASDPDGDQLTYSLETAPVGMKIDKLTGRIEWSIPSDAKGSHRTRIKVVDTQGGFAFQEFDLLFSPQKVSFSGSLLKSSHASLRLVRGS